MMFLAIFMYAPEKIGVDMNMQVDDLKFDLTLRR